MFFFSSKDRPIVFSSITFMLNMTFTPSQRRHFKMFSVSVINILTFVAPLFLCVDTYDGQLIDEYVLQYGQELGNIPSMGSLRFRYIFYWYLKYLFSTVTSLRICPTTSTMCTQNVEERLISMAEAELSKDVEDAFSSLHSLFSTRRNTFDGDFLVLSIFSNFR